MHIIQGSRKQVYLIGMGGGGGKEAVKEDNKAKSDFESKTFCYKRSEQ